MRSTTASRASFPVEQMVDANVEAYAEDRQPQGPVALDGVQPWCRRLALRPFFLSVAPNAPHTVSAKSKAEVEGTPALAPPRYANRFANAPLPRYPNFNEADISDKPSFVHELWPNQLTPDDIASLTDHYRGRMGALLGVDDLVGRVVKALKRAGVYKNTDIIFTSDNGWTLGEHRFRDPITQDGRATGVKYLPYEGTARVPLMAAGPDFPKQRVVNGVTVNADLAPTIEGITGAKPKLPQDGPSLVSVAKRPSLLDGRGVLLEDSRTHVMHRRTSRSARSATATTACRTARSRCTT